MLRRIEVMEAELDAGGNVGTMQECAGFSLCTFFRYDSEISLS